ncbi:hypothetical protein [Sinorhizobium meliloti]|uniref:hypothetical protein n=1 Tax=Rhizobium meliloti TaxID=382 RepID=UPI0012950EAB|nr:hypothetical protein [Sinorhizobium meliloti]MQX33288.1 hypothetical protein [Sinorhizobium meliloti]
MKEVRAVTLPDGQTHELLPDAVARHRHAFGGSGIWAVVIMPDGSSFVCREADGGAMDAERLDHRQTISKLIEIFGLNAFRGS